MIEKYISIPEEIEAVQFKITTMSEVVVLSRCTNFQLSQKSGQYNCLVTVNDGEKLLIVEGDYVIRDSLGKISVMKADIFAKSYIKKE